MHELAITESMVEAVTARVGDARVTRIALEVGTLTGVMPDALRFCFDVCAAGTTLEGAELEITEPQALARCRGCGAEFRTADVIPLCACGSVDVALSGGDELRIAFVEVA